MKINLKNQKAPLKIKQPKYFDNRGYFQEIFLARLIYAFDLCKVILIKMLGHFFNHINSLKENK